MGKFGEFIGGVFKSAGTGQLITDLVKEGGKLIDDMTASPEEKAEMRKVLFTRAIEDRQDARAMYKNDSWLQKIYAIVFLLSYLGLTFLVVSIFFDLKAEENVPEWGQAMINMIWGGMSAKINTITDFLFGSSSETQSKALFKK